ncbi:hypothetical protein BRADI_2g57694v3 [Brachypodium distachyon]|uniref:Uncharacterized protein n=1 Tax=Brachypodium distachyon TaxID=15368 RepID=A0A2K2DGG4_BRADI|nr:hypothetical protein BRADI_2g57694v3 [Brachypodium distachyon]
MCALSFPMQRDEPGNPRRIGLAGRLPFSLASRLQQCHVSVTPSGPWLFHHGKTEPELETALQM